MASRVLGGLTCQVVDSSESAEPEAAAILCHGFGAPGTDLVPLGQEFVSRGRTSLPAMRYYFPAAPLDLTPMGYAGGRAWWPLNIERLIRAAETGQLESIRHEHPEGLEAARELVTECVAAVQQETGLPLSKIILGGFSQGSMVTTDVALHLPDPVGGVMAWSGNLIAEEEWTELAGARVPLRFAITHGRQDPILPFAGAEALAAMLRNAGHRVAFEAFQGPHTISYGGLEMFHNLVAELATG